MPTTSKRILNVVTNVGHYDDPDHPTGLWLSELTHAWQVFEEAGFDQTLLSPGGGAVPLEPRSLRFPNYDKTAKAWRADPAKMALPAGKKMTGFAWTEEVLARVDKFVPYNAEQRAKDRGALYEKATLPFVSYAVVDGSLVTGQNPGSAKETAKKVVAAFR
ncbi:MAG: hypothetical protein ACT4P1_09290 [Sporichthyaceae bacterium]